MWTDLEEGGPVPREQGSFVEPSSANFSDGCGSWINLGARLLPILNSKIEPDSTLSSLFNYPSEACACQLRVSTPRDGLVNSGVKDAGDLHGSAKSIPVPLLNRATFESDKPRRIMHNDQTASKPEGQNHNPQSAVNSEGLLEIGSSSSNYDTVRFFFMKKARYMREYGKPERDRPKFTW